MGRHLGMLLFACLVPVGTGVGMSSDVVGQIALLLVMVGAIGFLCLWMGLPREGQIMGKSRSSEEERHG